MILSMILSFLSITSFDGYSLYKKANESVNRKGYIYTLNNYKQSIIKDMIKAADDGELSIQECLGAGQTKIRDDLLKEFNKIPGIEAWGIYSTSTYPCLMISWNQ